MTTASWYFIFHCAQCNGVKIEWLVKHGGQSITCPQCGMSYVARANMMTIEEAMQHLDEMMPTRASMMTIGMPINEEPS